MFNIAHHQRNANQNHNDISAHTSQKGATVVWGWGHTQAAAPCRGLSQSIRELVSQAHRLLPLCSPLWGLQIDPVSLPGWPKSLKMVQGATSTDSPLAEQAEHYDHRARPIKNAEEWNEPQSSGGANLSVACKSMARARHSSWGSLVAWSRRHLQIVIQ